MNILQKGFSVEPSVWRSGFMASHDLLQQHASQDHLRAFYSLGFTDTPPDLDFLDTVLEAVGWQIMSVAVPPAPAELFQLLAVNQLPVRLDTDLDTDVFCLGGGSWQRDLLGHLPWLLVPGHRQFVEMLAAVVERHRYSSASVRVAARLYWRTAVTGLFDDDGRTSVYGAALIGDPAEGRHALGPFAKRSPLHVKHAVSTRYVDEPCSEYAVVSGWDQLHQAFPMIEHMSFILSDFQVCPS